MNWEILNSMSPEQREWFIGEYAREQMSPGNINNLGFQGQGNIGQQTKSGAPTGLDYANLALSGVQTLGGLWGAYQQNKMAKKQFNFTKDVTNTNLRNQISAFNTALADRAAARAQAGSASFTEADRDKYIQENRLYR